MSAAFSPDGKKVLIGYADTREINEWDRSGSVQLLEVATGKPLLKRPLKHPRMVHAAAFSPDGKTFVTESGVWGEHKEKGQARFWAEDGREILPRRERPCMTTDVAFSPDGRQLLTANFDRFARLWDRETGRLGHSFGHQGPVRAAAFSPDGRRIVTGGYDGTVRLWDRATGQALGPPLRHPGLITALAFRPDGRALLTAAMDGTAGLWELAARPPAEPSWWPEGAFPLAFSLDREKILTREVGGTVRLRSAVTGQPSRKPVRPDGLAFSGALSPDGTTAVTVVKDRTVELWDLARGERIGRLAHAREVFAAAVSPDGRAAVTGPWYAAKVWDAATGKHHTYLKHPRWGPVFAVAYSPDGKVIATGSADRTTRLWDAATFQPLRKLTHDNAVFAVAFSPDSRRVLTGGQDNSARVWDVATGEPVGRPLTHLDSVFAVDFSPDGKMVLTGSHDQTARLWDVATGKPIGPPLVHPHPVHRVAFWFDGKTILTGHAAGAVGVTQSKELRARFGQVPTPREGDPEAIELWAQVVTGMELEANDAVRVLDAAAWEKRWQRLKESGFKGP